MQNDLCVVKRLVKGRGAANMVEMAVRERYSLERQIIVSNVGLELVRLFAGVDADGLTSILA